MGFKIDFIKSTVNVLVSSRVKQVTVRKPIAAALGHTAGDVVSESGTTGSAWTFENIARKNGGSGAITKAFIACETTNITPQMVLYLFTERPTSELNDNLANTAILKADIPASEGWVEFDAMEDLGTGVSVAMASPNTNGNLPLEFECAPQSRSLYGVLVTRDNVTITATNEITIKLFARQD